jgi:hypothetical protein
VQQLRVRCHVGCSRRRSREGGAATPKRVHLVRGARRRSLPRRSAFTVHGARRRVAYLLCKLDAACDHPGGFPQARRDRKVYRTNNLPLAL